MIHSKSIQTEPIAIPLVQPKLSEQLQQQAPAQEEVQPVLNTPDVFKMVHPNSAQVDLILKSSFLCHLLFYLHYHFVSHVQLRRLIDNL